MPKIDLKIAHEQMEVSPLFVVIIEGEGPYLESPEEQGLYDSDLQEGLMRMFLTREEAIRYAEIVAEYNDEEEFSTIKLTITELWKVIHILNDRSKAIFNCPLRVDLCYNLPNEHPESIDLIWNQGLVKQ